MRVIGLIREGKVPADNRVALTPAQCRWLLQHVPGTRIIVQSSATRCFTDNEYERSGVEVQEDLAECDLLLGIKEVPVEMLIPGKTYMFFSHTRKKQPYNQRLMHAMVEKKITIIDYECLEHEDGQRIIGFGFFAGIVGAHNGMMAFGNRSGAYALGRVGESRDYRELIHTYFGLRLPNIRIAITGSGRVAHGILEIMNLMDVQDIEPDEFLSKEFTYPVYVHLKGSTLYRHKTKGTYTRQEFHENPQDYECLFRHYLGYTDILMNGIYWEPGIPRLFEMDDMKDSNFRIKTIADITDDKNGSVPCNLGDQTIEDPVYGVDKISGEKTIPYLPGSVDVMAVGNLPNELPKDASRYFGEQLIKYVLEDLLKGGSSMIDKATILKDGQLTEHFEYLRGYVNGEW
ncbi:MAG: lysine ketoglutarate reductase [Chitinophagaceae bacterium]|jgi:alanine dehydrogenase|nr:lysine ketoglutarate reductase [Chitinophagaceae bacterium]